MLDQKQGAAESNRKTIPKDLLAVLRPFFSAEFIRFLISGATVTAVAIAIYQIALFFVKEYAAFAICFIIGNVYSAWINSRFTFGSRLTAARLALYLLAATGLWLLGNAVLYVIVEHLGIHERLAIFVLIPIMVPLNFLANRVVLMSPKVD